MSWKQVCAGVLVATIWVPSNVSAAPAQTRQVDDTCTVFAPEQIVPGQAFDLRVSRVPGYPGGWFSPTLRVMVSYPVSTGWKYSQIDQRTISEMGVIRIDASFLPPYSLYSDPEGGLVRGGTVFIAALVSEPISGGGSIRTYCAVTSTIAP